MTEVPDYLVERSRARRIALGLLEDDGSGGGGGGDAGGAGGGGEAAAASGPSTAEIVAAAKAAAAQTDVEPAPAPISLRVQAREDRHKIPQWVLPVLFLLPLWGFVYVKLTEPPPEGITSLVEGASVYSSRCASCHAGDGSGGAGRALNDGEVLLTFPELDESMIAWIEGGTAGIGEGNPYGNPDRPGGGRIAGSFGVMPAFGDQLNEHQLYAVARYVRESVSGEEVSAAEAQAREAEWVELGGGAAESGGGGH